MGRCGENINVRQHIIIEEVGRTQATLSKGARGAESSAATSLCHLHHLHPMCRLILPCTSADVHSHDALSFLVPDDLENNLMVTVPLGIETGVMCPVG